MVKQVEEQLPAAFPKELESKRYGEFALGIELKDLSFDVQSTPSLPSPYHATLSAFIVTRLSNYSTPAEERIGLEIDLEERWEITYAYENGAWKSKDASLRTESKFVSGNRSWFEEHIEGEIDIEEGPLASFTPAQLKYALILEVLADPYRRTLASGGGE